MAAASSKVTETSEPSVVGGIGQSILRRNSEEQKIT
jgi:hypothetical protein